jgi:uncharacterized delta-60 repeat protein
VLIALAALAPAAQAAPGDLDSSFGNGGRVILTPGGREVVYTDVAIQPDGKIVLAGYSRSSAGDNDMAITRLNPNGTPDMGFGAGGTVAVNVTTAGGRLEDLANAVALQPDGKIVVAGSTTSPTIDHVTVVRLHPSGTLDASFSPGGTDGDGISVTNPGVANDVAVDENGQIVTAGDTDERGGDGYVKRLNADGSDDISFGVAGAASRAAFDFGGTEGLSRLALQADGRVVVVGAGGPLGADSDTLVARFVPGTGWDPSFGSAGFRIYGFGSGVEDAAQDVVVEPGGKIDVAGWSGAKDFILSRLTSGGDLDNTLNGTSAVDADFGGGTANAIALQSNGKIVLGGSDATGFAIARFQPGGAPDATFGPGGKRTVHFAGTLGHAQGMALQPDGKIVLAGYVATAAASGAVVRLQGDSASEGGGPGGGSSGGGKAKVPRCGGKRATIVGTNKKNKLKGTRRADVIVGLGGNDTISGLGGNDIVCGGSGNDKVSGGKGNDKEYGGSGNDRLSGDAGNDKVSGEAGNDKESGGSGKDKLSGGPGKDGLNGGSGKDALNGGSGKDKCAGSDKKASC